MLALTENHIISLVSGTLSGLTLLAVAWIGRSGRKGRAEIKKAVKPENGRHDTLGGGLAAVENRLIDGEARFDRIEVQLTEVGDGLQQHLEEVAPLATWARAEKARTDKKRKK